jgi:hypothetical protein
MRVFLGEAHYGEHRNTNAHEPIVTPDLFDAAGRARVARRASVASAANGTQRDVAPVIEGGYQCQLEFRLAGWDLVIAPVDDRGGEHDFTFVVEAAPASSPTGAAVDELTRRLHVLLSFIAGREVGVGPVCGLTEAGEVIWAKWGSPRVRSGRPGVRWCSTPSLVASALPAIARGFSELSADKTMEAVIDRAVNHLLAADGNEALGARIPVACAGLEMLAWAILQHSGWLTNDVINQRDLNAAAKVRLLVGWAGVSTMLPADGFDALKARSHGLAKDWGGPEILFNARNKLVHPPRKLAGAEWPSHGEMVESRRLAGGYVELAVLRVLDYKGEYWSRLRRLDRYGADVEAVPWTC